MYYSFPHVCFGRGTQPSTVTTFFTTLKLPFTVSPHPSSCSDLCAQTATAFLDCSPCGHKISACQILQGVLEDCSIKKVEAFGFWLWQHEVSHVHKWSNCESKIFTHEKIHVPVILSSSIVSSLRVKRLWLLGIISSMHRVDCSQSSTNFFAIAYTHSTILGRHAHLWSRGGALHLRLA